MRNLRYTEVKIAQVHTTGKYNYLIESRRANDITERYFSSILPSRKSPIEPLSPTGRNSMETVFVKYLL